MTTDLFLTNFIFLVCGFLLAWFYLASKIQQAEIQRTNAELLAINAQKRERAALEKHEALIYQLEEKSNATMRAVREISISYELMQSALATTQPRPAMQVMCRQKGESNA